MSSAAAETGFPVVGYGVLFLRFLKFGCLAFGGPAAQIAMIRRELVEQERWVSPERFNRLLAVMQALPGPEAHELCVHLGVGAKGRLGGVLAGLGFMLPGFLLMVALAWLYFAFDLAGAGLRAAFLGAQAAVIAIVARAAHRLAEHVWTDRSLVLLGFAAAAVSFIGGDFWIVLPTAGLAYALRAAGREGFAVAITVAGLGAAVLLAMYESEPAAPVLASVSTTEPGDFSPALLFLSGLKAGLLTFGGAYTAIPYLRADTVERGRLPEGQFLDGVAFAQVLPAPLVIFATFVGYAAGGIAGALAITAGMFLPAFAFSLLFYERLERLTEARRLSAFLAGVAAAAIGVVVSTAFDLARSTAERVPDLLGAIAIAAASLAVLYVWKSRLAPAWIVLAAGAAGWALWG